MEFLEFKKNIIDKNDYCKDLVTSFQAPMTPNLFMLCKNYGSRIVSGIKEVKNNKVVIIPEKILLSSGFYGFVEELDVLCFKNNTFVTDIILPSTIIRFQKGQFEGCSNLRRITIPKGIKAIPTNCFKGCNNLEDVYYEKSSDEFKKVIKKKNEGYFYKSKNPDVIKKMDNGNEMLLRAKIHFDCDFIKHIDGKVKSVIYAFSGRGKEFLNSPSYAQCTTKIGNKSIIK